MAIVALIYGLSRGQPDGWSSPKTVVPLAVCVVAFAVFVWVEGCVADPLINFRLFRHLNFLASTISQVLAGALELGLGKITLWIIRMRNQVLARVVAPGGPHAIPAVLAGGLA